MGFAEEEHAEAALAYASAYALRQAAGKEFLVEVEFRLRLLSREFQLAQEGGLVDTDTHRREFETVPEDRIPHEDVAVQAGKDFSVPLGRSAPVVVVGGTSVMLPAISQGAAYAGHENGPVLLADGIFPLLGSQVRVKAAELLGVSPSECLYFGDTWTDMKTGRNAGMHTIGVLWGYRDRKELEENGAERIIEKPDEIPGLVKENWN